MLRAALSLLLTSAAATTVFARPDPAWTRRSNEAAMAREEARMRADAWEREVRARARKAEVDAALRRLAPGELAGGPGAALPVYRPSTIVPIEPYREPPPAPSADAARMDAIMAEALARSNARVRALTPGDGR